MSNVQAVAFGFVERLAQDLKDERLELPAFPEAVLRIQQALQSSDTDTADIVRILSSEPALAARLLRIANSAEFRRADTEITDLRKAISRMGFNMVRTVAVAFAMRQLRRKESYGAETQAELEKIWKSSLQIAAICFVLAKHFTRLSADQALLTGLLHVLGRLYIVMRAEDMDDVSDEDIRSVASGWHGAIGKAILESWGLPESLQHAIEHQDDTALQLTGDVTLTDLLIVAKLLASTRPGTTAPECPAFTRLKRGAGDKTLTVVDDYADEIKRVQSSLSE
jgi:HD-like signal output (HDOD) protein